MRINKLDHKLFHYLFRYRTATRVQIARDVYNHKNMTSTGNRLRALARAKIITIKGHHLLEGRKVYGLTRKALMRYIYDGKIPFFASKSYCPFHDIKLLEAMKRFEGLREIDQVVTENQIRLEKVKNSSSLIRLGDINPDGLMRGKINGIEVNFLIELERKQKTKQAYQDLVKRFYSNDEVDIVLYLCEYRHILNEIQSVEDNYLLGGQGKIFYSLCSDFFSSDSPLFSSLDGNEIRFSKCGTPDGTQYVPTHQKPLKKMLELIGINQERSTGAINAENSLMPLHKNSRTGPFMDTNVTGELNG